MATFLHRTTMQLLPSTSESSLSEPVANYIENPDLSTVTGFPSKYWIITGDVVTLMIQTARDAVDAAAVELSRDSVVTELDQVEGVLRAFMLLIIDELNILRSQHSLSDRTVSQLRSAIRNKLGT